MRFVFVTDQLQEPGGAGHLAMNHALIVWLRDRGHEVRVLLLAARLPRLVQYYAAAPVTGIGIRAWRGYVFPVAPRAIFGVLGRAALAKLPRPASAALKRLRRRQRYAGADEVIGAPVTATQRAWCAAAVARLRPDAVIADTVFRAPIFRAPIFRAPAMTEETAETRRIIIASDVFHLRHRALSGQGYRVFPLEMTPAMEAELLNLADLIVAIHPRDAASFRVLCPDKTVCSAPMPALPCPRPPQLARIPGRLVFVGSTALPNLDGLRWFFAEIWPLLKRLRPSVTLDLVGDCGPALGRVPEGVTVLGRVRELSGILHRAALAIAPLRIGSGLKIKILDYARHGLLTVATAEAQRGFAADATAPFIPAETAGEFATAIASALAKADPADEERTLRYVTKHYGVEASFAELAVALENISFNGNRLRRS